MRFLAADRLWLLGAVALLAAAYVAVQRRRRGDAVRFTNLALLATVAPKRPGWRRHLPAAVLLLALVSMVTALARPTRPTRVARQRATIVLAVDVSISMEATDVAPSRLESAKAAATGFVDALPARLDVGLVSFAGTAQVLVSPTVDHSLVKAAIARLTLAPRTAIGEAIFACLDSIAGAAAESGSGAPPARIVLMSDGTTTTGRPDGDAAQAAKDAGVPVSTIAFGTDQGVIELGDTAIRVPVNKPALRAVAELTGGRFFEAATAEQLRRVYAGIGSSVGYVTSRREVTTWFVGAGVALALLAAAGSLLWSSRLP